MPEALKIEFDSRWFNIPLSLQLLPGGAACLCFENPEFVAHLDWAGAHPLATFGSGRGWQRYIMGDCTGGVILALGRWQQQMV